MAEEYGKREEGIEIPKVSYEGDDRNLKEQVIHYEKGTRRILIFTIVGLIMGWFSYRYYGESFLPLKIVLAVPYKLSEMLHNAFHPAIYTGLGMADAMDEFFPQAPIISRLAEYGTSALFGGAIYGSLAYFSGDKRIFTLSRYVRFGCVWAAVIGVWTAVLFGLNGIQVAENNDLKNVTGFFIMGEYTGQSYYLGQDETAGLLVDSFYEGNGPKERKTDSRNTDGELEIEIRFGKDQGYMRALISPKEGYLVTDEGRMYQMTDSFMEVYRACLSEEDQGYEEMDD